MSDDNVTKLYTSRAAENPDNVLEQAVGVYDSVFLVGKDKEGRLDMRSSTNIGIADNIALCTAATTYLSMSYAQSDLFEEDDE